MDKDISCLNFKGLFKYIENRFGKEALASLVDNALAGENYLIENKHTPGRFEQVSIDHLNDESYWVCNELSLALLAGIKDVVPGPEPEQEAGREAILSNLSHRDLFFCRIMGPRALARKVTTVNARFNRTKTVTLDSLDNRGATFSLTYRPGVRVTKDVCNWNLGIYEGVGRVAGARNIRARETRCVVDGDPACEFRVDWQKPGLLKRMGTALLNLFTKDLVAEYEKTLDERDRLIEKLKTSESQYRLLIENQTDMVVKVDPGGRLLFVSPSYCRMFGKSEADLVGSSFMPMVHPDDQEATRREMETLFSPPHTCYVEQRVMTEKGWLWIAWSDTALVDDRGKVKEIIGVGRDITSQKTAEEALALAAEHKKMALVGQVAGKLAHDFNNILGGILGNAELSLLDCENEADRQSFDIIVAQAVRGRNLTRNLVAFAKDQEPKQEFFRVDEKLDLVLNLMKKDLEGIRVVREFAPDLPELLADPGMIEHALVNLLQNSIHATSLCRSPEIAVAARREGRRLIIEIRDNGCGIPEDFQNRIFDPSFTLKGLQDKAGAYRAGIKGTGYGLANVKKYIEQHRGSLSITSEVDAGTCAVISLPVVEKTLTKQELTTVETMTWQENRRILLVEDEQDIRDVQYRLLTQAPCRHRVDIAKDGQSAKDLFSLNQYDLVSLDYVLPGGISGMDVYHDIRATDREVPVLFISGNLEFIASIMELKRKDPRTEHLSKPCLNMEYLKSVNALLAMAAGPGSPPASGE